MISYPLLLILAVLLAALGCGGSGAGTNTTGGGNGGEGGGGGFEASFTAPISIGAPQPLTLSVEVSGTTATGTLIREDDRSRAIEAIPAGTHILNGTSDGVANYDLTGTVPGGGVVRVKGKLPTANTPGDFELECGEETASGGLLPKSVPVPSITPTTPAIGGEPGLSAILEVEPANMPEGKILYRWFVAAPSAYFTTIQQSTVNGQDVWVEENSMKVNTSQADQGVLKVHIHAYLEKDGIRTFLDDALIRVELEDVRFPEPVWVSESAANPNGGQVTVSYFWEFPTYGDAKEYIVSSYDSNSGQETMRHAFTKAELDSTEVTGVPIYVGVVPHSFPPRIPVRETLSGTVRRNFIRRGTVVRMLILITGEGEDATLYRQRNPISVKVKF